jgi:hypothetical protein
MIVLELLWLTGSIFAGELSLLGVNGRKSSHTLYVPVTWEIVGGTPPRPLMIKWLGVWSERP